MHNLYRSHFYSDSFNCNSNLGLLHNSSETATCIELSMTFMHIMPKNFEIADFVHNKDKENYFLMFSFTLQFIEKNGSIEFRKSRFSIMGTDTDNTKLEEYTQYPLNYSFKDFIKDQYLEIVNHANKIFIDKTTYTISPEDKVKIVDCVKHLETIFPNEKDFFILNQVDADFYQPDNSQDGVLLYQNSCKVTHMQILDEKFPEKTSGSPAKKSKI